MSQIQIGTTIPDNKKVSINLPVLLRTHLQIQGASGSGKSWMVRLLAEQFFGKVPVIIIDQEGEYATLREKFDYVLVGKGGEAPATIQSAGLLSHRLLELRASAVVDLYDLDIPSRKTWIKKFFEGVMSAPKNLWRPTVFIIDEAHDFIPEKMESECAHILASAISKGRKRGFAFICATQRLSKLNKDVASELQNVLIGKTWLDIDRDRGASALGIYGSTEKNKFSDEVKRLEQGQFFAQGAAISMDRTLLKSGTVTTSHPDSSNLKGRKDWLTPPPTPKAVAAMLGKLGDLPKEAELEAQTVAELKRKIVELKRDLKVLPKTILSPTSKPVNDTKGMELLQGKLTSCQKDLQVHKDFIKVISIMFKQKNKQIVDAASILLAGTKIEFPKKMELPEMPKSNEKSTGTGSKPHYVSAVPQASKISTLVYQTPVGSHKQSHGSVGSEGMGEGLNNKQVAILRALNEFLAIGRDSVPRNWIAHRAGASHRSSAYANNVSNLRSKGYIDYTGDGLALTPEGQQMAPEVAIPLTTEEMYNSCLRMLSNKEGAIFTYLHSIYPESSDREKAAGESGASPLSSAYANNVSSLKSAGMITYQADRSLRAADWLFID